MALHQDDHRLIYYLESIVFSEAKGKDKIPTPVKSSSELIEGIQYLLENDKVVQFFDNRKKTIFLSDIEIIDEKAILLINISDRAASDITFSDPTLHKRRVASKEPGEGIEVSTHLIWDLTSIESKPNAYTMLLEHSIGMSTGRINNYLNFLLREIAKEFPGKYSTPHPDGILNKNGNPKYVKYVSKLSLQGKISDELISDLNLGSLQDIEIYTEQRHGVSWDGPGAVFTDREIIRLKPRHKKSVGGWWKVVKSAVKKDPDNYEFATIHFNDRDEIPRQATIYSDTLRIANDFKYVKKGVITDFVVPLVTGYEKINQEIIGKMLELVK